MSLADSSMPWLFSGLASLFIIAIGFTVKSWREAKRSPYFFLRRQAQIRLQQYATVSVVFAFLGAAVAWYGWSPVQDTTSRFATISNTKPVFAAESAGSLNDEPPQTVRIDSPAAAAAIVNQPVVVNVPVASSPTDTQTVDAFNVTVAVLPPEYSTQFEPQANLSDKTQLGNVSFSKEVNDAYEAVLPSRIFEAGRYTIYATFSYDGMTDGMEWAWVWRYNGQPVSGGTQMWDYGVDGPGYVYYNPEEGFQSGQYTLQIWVNEALMTESNLIVTGAAASR